MNELPSNRFLHVSLRRCPDAQADAEPVAEEWKAGPTTGFWMATKQTDISIMSIAQANATVTPYIDFWNAVLAPKFNAWRHILAGGLHLHSAIVFPSLPIRTGDSVLDVGCGWGDTAIELARRVGPAGSVLGLDCCNGFLDAGRADARDAGIANLRFLEA